MLQFRVVAALAAWGFFMMGSSKAGAYEWVFAAMFGFVLSLLPMRWFIFCAALQIGLAGANLVFVPGLLEQVGWLGGLFFFLNLVLNGGLYALVRKDKSK